MTQNPLAFHAFAFKDSNEYQWSAARAGLNSPIIITCEKDAPYTVRRLEVPANFDEKEIRAFVEATVAIPQRDKAAAFRVPKKKTDVLKPLPKPDNGDGFGFMILAFLALLALGGKKKRR